MEEQQAGRGQAKQDAHNETEDDLKLVRLVLISSSRLDDDEVLK